MSDISRLSKLATGIQRGQALNNNELLVNNVKIKAGSGNDAFYATFSGSLTAVRTISIPDANVDLANIAALVSLSGVAANATDLGTFTGATIPDSSTIKSALQSLETAHEEVDQNVNDLITLSGVAENSTHLGTFTGAIIPDSSTVKSAFQSLETYIEALPDPMEYKGVWDASTNDPELEDGIGDNGDVYHVSVAGTVDFGSGNITFEVGDKVVYNGALGVWEKWDVTDAVTSVNGQTGAVVLEADDIDVASGYTAGAGTVSDADTVQSALQKLDGNITAHLDDTTDAHDASAISFAPYLTLSSTNVQAVIEELKDEVDAAGSSVVENVRRIADLGETSITAGVKAFRWAKAADSGFVAGRLYLADNDASSVDNFHVCGLYVAAGDEVITDSLTIVKVGKLSAPSHGFTIGQPIWLSSSGALTSTAPTADNIAAVKVGMAETADLIDVAIEIFGVN